MTIGGLPETPASTIAEKLRVALDDVQPLLAPARNRVKAALIGTTYDVTNPEHHAAVIEAVETQVNAWLTAGVSPTGAVYTVSSVAATSLDGVSVSFTGGDAARAALTSPSLDPEALLILHNVGIRAKQPYIVG